MKTIPASGRPTMRGNPDYFTGTVWLDEIAGPEAPGRLRAYRVSFEPGARTAWHTHPHGQVLHVLSGLGLAQRENEAVTTLAPGDTVWIAPRERHWHGAAPGHAMAHLALQEADDSGNHSTWDRQVTDEEYRGDTGNR
jgi:quercetin dioxygenase-like cupin family protein